MFSIVAALTAALATPAGQGQTGSPAADAASAVPASISGVWSGDIHVGSAPAVQLTFRLTQAAERLSAEVEASGQGKLPATNVSRDGDRLEIAIASAGARFSGRISGTGDRIDGTWYQSGLSLPLSLARVHGSDAVTAAPRRRHADEPVPPYPYRAQEVAYDNVAGKSHLAGTLTLPPGPGPFPAALLITGSGLQDRDETVLGHKPFLVLADYLTRRGIAVLRVDDRAMGGSTGDVEHATTADFAGDVEAGLAFLRRRSDIDRHRLGLIGHSEGAVIAPMVAARDPGVAWTILIGAPGLKGDRIILTQQRKIALASGMSEQATAQAQTMEAELLAAVAASPDQETAARRAREILTKGGVPASAIEPNVRRASQDWFRYYLSYDPRPALASLRIPVLAIIGGLDLQVIPEENAPALKLALAHDVKATVLVLPRLNHLLQTATTGSVSEYASIEETIAPAALETIGRWVEGNVTNARRARLARRVSPPRSRTARAQ